MSALSSERLEACHNRGARFQSGGSSVIQSIGKGVTLDRKRLFFSPFEASEGRSKEEMVCTKDVVRCGRDG